MTTGLPFLARRRHRSPNPGEIISHPPWLFATVNLPFPDAQQRGSSAHPASFFPPFGSPGANPLTQVRSRCARQSRGTASTPASGWLRFSLMKILFFISAFEDSEEVRGVRVQVSDLCGLPPHSPSTSPPPSPFPFPHIYPHPQFQLNLLFSLILGFSVTLMARKCR